MIFRKERPRCRDRINRILVNQKWNMQQLYDYAMCHKWEFSSGLLTQIRKMYDEYQTDEYVKTLEYVDYNGRLIPIVKRKRKGSHFLCLQVLYCVGKSPILFFYGRKRS